MSISFYRRLASPALGLIALFAGASSLSAQVLETDCAASPLVPNKVELTWPDVPTEDSLATLHGSSATLFIGNRSADELDYRLIGRLHAGGERLSVPLGFGSLGPFETTTKSIDLAGFGVDVQDLAFSGRLSVEAKSYDAAGELADRSHSPTTYFHALGGTPQLTLLLYRETALRTQFNYGDLQFQVNTSTAPDSRILQIFDGGKGTGSDREGAGPGSLAAPDGRGNGGGGYGASNDLTSGPPKWEFCMRWIYESIDSGFGEDHYKSGYLMKARGMRVVVDHINWAQPKEFFASDDNGCFSFEASENMGFRIAVFAEARLGGTDNVTVRAYPSLAQANVNNPDQVPMWLFIANPGGSPRRVYYESGVGELANLAAFGSFIFHWVDHQTSPRLSGDRNLILCTSTCGGGSCQSDDLVRMAPGASNRKFLVGHEVGHWMHRQWTDDNMGYDGITWAANSSDPDCAFAGVGSHAMRSKEYSVGGFTEGFAHYISALAWNSHTSTTGIFKYYKETVEPQYADLAADNWRVDLEGAGVSPLGGVSNWMANMCTVHDGHSVEMDWLRFYWDYRTNAGLKPTHFDIFQHVGYTRDFHPWVNNFGAYDQMLQAINDGALGQLGLAGRFAAQAIANGVAQ